MKTLEIEQTSPVFRRATRLGRGEVLVLTRHGKPAFAVVGVGDEFALESLALSRNTEFMGYLDGIAERMRRGGASTLDDVCSRFDSAPESPRNGRAKRGSGDRRHR